MDSELRQKIAPPYQGGVGGGSPLLTKLEVALPSLPRRGLSRSHAPAWECSGQRTSVAGKGRWRVPTAFPRWRVGTKKRRSWGVALPSLPRRGWGVVEDAPISQQTV